MIVADLPRPSGGRPSLLTHDDVETLFQEFGHVLRKTLARPELPSFSSGKCEREFVEAPSQLLEHWAWNAEVLARFALHHETGEPLPRETLERMTAARRAGSGVAYLRQVCDAAVDFAMHSPGFGGDSTATARAVRAEVGYAYPPGTHFQGGWTHMLRLDAGYYGSLWSRALGDDMFTVFERTGPLDLDRAAGSSNPARPATPPRWSATSSAASPKTPRSRGTWAWRTEEAQVCGVRRSSRPAASPAACAAYRRRAIGTSCGSSRRMSIGPRSARAGAAATGFRPISRSGHGGWPLGSHHRRWRLTPAAPACTASRTARRTPPGPRGPDASPATCLRQRVVGRVRPPGAR